MAQQLGIDHLVFNFGDDFDKHVVDPYVAAHANGTTPNPCIECNRSVKFARLAERAAVRREPGVDPQAVQPALAEEAVRERLGTPAP